ncbi:hypothetical protein [Pseudactinotalea sp.]|uniref:hypothetical protein n=1 Tax=Pseudactinotalea sp. TaxID=1926260 RepID=UPI003B3B3315
MHTGTTVREDSREARLAAAQRALATAEASAGLRQRLTGVTTLAAAGAGPAQAPPSTSLPPELLLPLPAGLEEVLPWGGLRRGAAVQVSGSRSVLLTLAAAAADAPGQDLWCAVMAMPDVGLAAAAEAGLDLSRTVVVPQPGPDAPSVLGALIDGFDVVVLGPCRALSEADRRSAGHRLRNREALLLSGGAWPGAQAVLEVGERSWLGVGAGEGVLTGREATITGYVRGLGQPRRVRVRMDADGGVTPVGERARLVSGEGELHGVDLARAG